MRKLTTFTYICFINQDLIVVHWINHQDDTIRETESSVHATTKENMENLVKIGEGLLKKPVSRVNLETGIYEPVENEGTNEEALKKWEY